MRARATVVPPNYVIEHGDGKEGKVALAKDTIKEITTSFAGPAPTYSPCSKACHELYTKDPLVVCVGRSGVNWKKIGAWQALVCSKFHHTHSYLHQLTFIQ
jgi:hypothetical protein